MMQSPFHRATLHIYPNNAPKLVNIYATSQLSAPNASNFINIRSASQLQLVDIHNYAAAVAAEGTAVSVEAALRGGFGEVEVETAGAGAGKPSLNSSSIALRPSSVSIGIPDSMSFSKYFGTNLKRTNKEARQNHDGH